MDVRRVTTAVHAIEDAPRVRTSAV
jgi:hypothetical protein